MISAPFYPFVWQPNTQASRGTLNTPFRQCGLIAKVHTTVFGVVKLSNSGTKRRHKGAPPLVGESELKHESELKPYRIGYDRDLILQ
jgi:hypothetical protein